MEIQWSLVLFTAISGAGAWLFASQVISNIAKAGKLPTRLDCIVSFVMVVVGGVASATHIMHHIDRIVNALSHPTSGIFTEAALVGVICAVIAVYFIMLVRGASEKSLRVVGVIGALVGIVFSFACGSSYMMGSRPAWMNYALPLSYCLTAAAAGAGINLLMQSVQNAEAKAIDFAAKLTVVLSALAVVICLVFVGMGCSYLAQAGTAAIVWTVVLFAMLALGIVLAVRMRGASAGDEAQAEPAAGEAAVQAASASSAAVACVVLVAAIAMRVVMWLIGTPVLDFFRMPLG